jgi:hypothetical protein
VAGRTQKVRARKGFKNRSNVVAKFSVADACLLQNVPSEHVKIKLRRDVQMAGLAKNGFDQARMIEHRIASVRIGQKIDK